jgi:hypothetical protein
VPETGENVRNDNQNLHGSRLVSFLAKKDRPGFAGFGLLAGRRPGFGS